MDLVEKNQLKLHNIADHWYYKSKYLLLKKYIESLDFDLNRFTTLDVGSGMGIFLRKMELDGFASPNRSVGMDPALKTSVFALESKIQIHPYYQDTKTYDLILLMDILEHVEDDQAILQKIKHYAKKGTYVFITVPAHPCLWSSHDRFLGHFRRYTLNNLSALVKCNPHFEVIHSHYYFAGILPLIVPIRLLQTKKMNPTSSDLKPVWQPINMLLEYICKNELFFSRFNRFAGLSAVVVCKVV